MATEIADRFWPISGDAMARAQFWDCKRCRAVVLHREDHDKWHTLNDSPPGGAFGTFPGPR